MVLNKNKWDAVVAQLKHSSDRVQKVELKARELASKTIRFRRINWGEEPQVGTVALGKRIRGLVDECLSVDGAVKRQRVDVQQIGMRGEIERKKAEEAARSEMIRQEMEKKRLEAERLRQAEVQRREEFERKRQEQVDRMKAEAEKQRADAMEKARQAAVERA